MTRFKSALLAATLLVSAGGIAFAQTAPTYDPTQLPSVKGKVVQYLLSPRGDIDGLLLADGTEVHLNPMLSAELAFSVKPGDAVTIHGLKAKATPMVAAASITNDATGATVTGRMGRGAHDRAASIEAEGTVKAALHEPRGEINGVLLDNGTVVRLPPAEAKKFAAQLAVGQKLYVRGFGAASPLGKVVMARQLGADRAKLSDVAMPSMHERMGMMGHGMKDHGAKGGIGEGMPGGHGPMGMKPPATSD